MFRRRTLLTGEIQSMNTVRDVKEFLEDRESIVLIEDASNCMTEEVWETYQKTSARLIHAIGAYTSPSEVLGQEDQEIFKKLEGIVYKALAARRLRGLAPTHAMFYSKHCGLIDLDWRSADKEVLANSVFEYVRDRSPRGTSSEEIATLTDLTLKELAKLPAPQEPDSPQKRGEYPPTVPRPDEFWPT